MRRDGGAVRRAPSRSPPSRRSMKRRWRPFSMTLILSRPELNIASKKENIGFEMTIECNVINQLH